MREQQLAEDVYRSLMDQSLLGFIMIQGVPPRYRAVNRAFADMVGYTEQELVELTPEEVVGLIHPDDVAIALGPYAAVATGESDHADITFRYVRKDGSVRWLTITGSPALYQGEPAVLALCSDITDQKRAEEALRENERQYRLLAENVSDIIWTMDLDLNATYVSPSEARLRGYTLEEVRRHRFDERLTPESIARARAGIQGAMQAEVRGQRAFPVTAEMDMVCADGSLLPTETTVSLLRDELGRPTGFLGVTRDITRRKRIEAERLALEAQVQRAQKLESLGLLVGGIAHDFNNLLHGLNINMAALRDQLSADSPALARLEDMGAATRQAADLCRQMLAYAGKGRVRAEPLDLNRVVSEMRNLLETSLPPKGRLSKELGEGIPTLAADVSQVRQVLMNLVTNGAEALGPDGGTVTLRTGHLRCDDAYLKDLVLGQEASPGAFVYVEVQDDGEGMDDETRSNIFEPFFSTKFTGRGLGLAAVLGIVRAHRGAVDVETAEGQGTRVRVLLPVVSRVPAPEAAEAPSAVDLDGQGRRVLVVDDDRLSREGLELVLSAHGFDVVMADGGRAALDIMGDPAQELAVVLLDLTMPDLDGVDTFLRLREIRPELPVILCSGYGVEEAVERFGELKAHLAGFLHKPYDTPELLAKLRDVLQ